MATYRLWPSTNGPTTATSFSGGFISGMTFCVTSEAWFQGYWWWVCPSGSQLTTATKCALWQVQSTSPAQPVLVPGSVVTSGTLTAGQWNYIPLSAPIALSAGGSTGMTPPVGSNNQAGMAQYTAAIGCNGPFPDTNNYWGAGQTAPSGITNGPLTAFSAPSASMPALYQFSNVTPQGSFSTAGSDPSTNYPGTASSTDNFWVDVQVADYVTAISSPTTQPLRLWPSLPAAVVAPNTDTGLAVSGTAFTLSQACTLNKILMYNPASSTGLPSSCGIWDTDTGTIVSGTFTGSPTWLVYPGGGSATAGAGWIYVDYSSSGVTLPAGNYATAYFNGNAARIYSDSHNYFFAGTNPVGGGTVGGPGHAGLSYGNGVLTSPNVAGGPTLIADASGGGLTAGQSTAGTTQYTGPTAFTPTTTWVYPTGFEVSADWGETRWADVEVIPVSTGTTVALTTPNLALAAPLVSVAVSANINLTTPNLALAAPLVTAAGSGAAHVALTTPNLALAAPNVSATGPGNAQQWGKFIPWPTSSWPI